MAVDGSITFAAADRRYLYDSMTNAIVELPAGLALLPDALPDGSGRSNSGHDAPEARAFLDACRAAGLLRSLSEVRFSRPTTDEIAHALDHRIERLTLGTSEQCNLRCSYCVFSGTFPSERTHADAHMSCNTARRSVDFYLERTPSPPEGAQSSIGFYGGEPVLRWDVIRDVVLHVKTQWSADPAMRPRISLTTNGTLLTDARLEFLLEHGVFIYLSLDGPAEIHDASRVFSGGRPTHARVLDVVRRIAAQGPDGLSEHLALNCTVDPRHDIRQVARFFADHGMADVLVMSNRLNAHGTGAFALSEEERRRHVRNVDALVEDYFAALRGETAPFAFHFFRTTFRRVFQGLPERRRLEPPPQVRTPAAICIPGCSKLFVDVRGTLHACENFYYPEYAIGTLDRGFDLARIVDLMDWWVDYAQDHCQRCWAFRLCNLCYFAAIDVEGRLSRDRLRTVCQRQREIQLDALSHFVAFWRREEAEGVADHPESLHTIVRLTNEQRRRRVY